MDEIRQDYFQWLCESVGVDMPEVSYWLLLKELHSIPFRWDKRHFPHDENRAMDGVSLRELYGYENDLPEAIDILDDDCTVLEALIALAERMDFETSSPDDRRSKAPDFFWEMIGNLYLANFTDDRFYQEGGGENVRYIINKWLDRNIDRNGFGGPFHVRSEEVDQGDLEIWDQMQLYLNERH